MARKTTVKTETVKTDSVKSESAKSVTAKAPRATRAVKAKPSTDRNLYSLQLVTGAAVLTEAVAGGVVTAPKPKPGSTVQISYLKEVAHPLSAAKLHARLDGVALDAKLLGHTDAEGRFVRTPAAVELTPDAQKLEYWFELTTADGQTLWDSNWGRNHWLEVELNAATGA